jgi:hypothetical protein
MYRLVEISSAKISSLAEIILEDTEKSITCTERERERNLYNFKKFIRHYLTSIKDSDRGAMMISQHQTSESQF